MKKEEQISFLKTRNQDFFLDRAPRSLSPENSKKYVVD
jgi:hypothetical protein